MVEGGTTATQGGHADSQDTLNGAPVEVAEYPGVHFDPLQPEVEEEPLSGFLYDGVGVVSPGQIFADVNPEEPEAAESLHHSPIDREGLCPSPCFFLPSFFVVGICQRFKFLTDFLVNSGLLIQECSYSNPRYVILTFANVTVSMMC